VTVPCALFLSGYDPREFSIRCRLIEDHGVSKKFLIPVFAFAVAALGCSGSRDDTIGSGGAAGSTSGAGASTAGTGGPAAGTEGSTAGSSGGTDGTDGTDAGSDGSFPACNLETFCPVFLAYCGTTTPGYTTLTECMATFAAVGVANPYQQQCETYHLCIAIFDTGSDRTLHCSHAAGAGMVCGL
jgi:hypothetical protein